MQEFKRRLALLSPLSIDLGATLRPLLWRFVGTSLALSLFGAAIYFSDQVDWVAVTHRIRRFKLAELAPVAALAVLQVGLQAARLWTLLPSRMRIPFGVLSRGFWIAQTMNQLLPARAGDVFKVAFLKKNSATGDSAVGTPELIGTVFIADKIADISALFLLLAILAPDFALMGTSSRQFNDLMQIEAQETVLIVGCFTVAFALLGWKLAPLLRQFARAALRGARALASPRRLAFALALALASWGVECEILRQLAACLGYPLAYSEALVAIGVLNIGIAVPVSFANLGAFEGALAFGLSRFQIALPEALAIAGVHHTLQFAAVVGPAGILVALDRWFGGSSRAHDRRSHRVRHEDKQQALRYYEGRSPAYSQLVSNGPLHWLRRREWKFVVELLDLPSSGSTPRLLDVGCGDGKYSLFAKASGAHVTAMDACAGMVSRLHEKLDLVHVVDWEEHAVIHTYDRVLCAGMLDFVLDPKSAFGKLCQSVAPGGRLVVLVPKRGLGGLFYRVEKKFAGFQVNLFCPLQLTDWAKEHGLHRQGIESPLPNNMVMAFDRPS
jgi:SAM-dependent methyltransferase/uncharacterized membrane protein YbhN (UPF0104 family)